MAVLLALLGGCGTTNNRSATEQIVTSDAVDRSVARIDFSPLAGKRVFFDVDYLKIMKAPGPTATIPGPEYVISSLRQQMLMAGCLLQETKTDAEYIVEARIGAMGIDMHEVVYGIPANNALNAASSVVPAMPGQLPAIPELALSKRNDQMGAAKLGAFAYDRVTREVVWQSGISQSRSTSRDTWVAGVGPFQSGSVRRSKGGKFSPLPAVFSDEKLSPLDERYGGAQVYIPKTKSTGIATVATPAPPASAAATPAAAAPATAAAAAPVAATTPATPPAAAAAATTAPAATPAGAIQQASATVPAPSAEPAKPAQPPKPIKPPALFPGNPDSPRLLTPLPPE